MSKRKRRRPESGSVNYDQTMSFEDFAAILDADQEERRLLQKRAGLTPADVDGQHPGASVGNETTLPEETGPC